MHKIKIVWFVLAFLGAHRLVSIREAFDMKIYYFSLWFEGHLIKSITSAKTKKCPTEDLKVHQAMHAGSRVLALQKKISGLSTCDARDFK